MLIAIETAQALSDATPIAAGTLATILSMLAILRRQLAKNDKADEARDAKIADMDGAVRGVAAEIKILGSEVKAALLERDARFVERLSGVERSIVDRIDGVERTLSAKIEGHGSRLSVVETRVRNGRRSSASEG